MSTRPKIIPICMQVKRVAKRLEGSIRRYAGVRSSSGRVKCGEVNSWYFCPWPRFEPGISQIRRRIPINQQQWKTNAWNCTPSFQQHAGKSVYQRKMWIRLLIIYLFIYSFAHSTEALFLTMSWLYGRLLFRELGNLFIPVASYLIYNDSTWRERKRKR